MAVNIFDVAAELGVAAPEQGSPTEAQWVLWIRDAEALVADVADARSVDLASLPEARFDRVVRLMVANATRNADGATSVSQQVSVDDASTTETRRYDGASGPSGLTLSDDLAAYLFGTARTSAFGSVRLAVPAWRQPRCGL